MVHRLQGCTAGCTQHDILALVPLQQLCPGSAYVPLADVSWLVCLCELITCDCWCGETLNQQPMLPGATAGCTQRGCLAHFSLV